MLKRFIQLARLRYRLAYGSVAKMSFANAHPKNFQLSSAFLVSPIELLQIVLLSYA